MKSIVLLYLLTVAFVAAARAATDDIHESGSSVVAPHGVIRAQSTTAQLKSQAKSDDPVLIGAGDIEIESAGRDGVEVLHRIPKAETFYNELLTTMNAPPSAGAPSRPAGL